MPSISVASKYTRAGISTKKHIVYLGINANKFRPPTNKALVKKKLGLTNDFVIGYHGRIGREKLLGTLYKAFKIVEKKHKVQLLIVGGGVKDYIEKFSTEDNIRLIPPTNNVVPYVQAMDVYVLPSLTETTSLSTMEAMSCGVPVICTPVGLVKNYVINNVNGYLFPIFDHQTLAKKINYLIEHRERAKLMGRKARMTIKRKYTWDKTAKEILKALNL